MRAVEITKPGGPEVLKPADRPVPAPRENEILVKVAAAGVNRGVAPEAGLTYVQAGLLEAIIGLAALRAGAVPGIATLDTLDPDCGPLNASRVAREPRSKVALLLSRGFGGTNTACLLRAP